LALPHDCAELGKAARGPHADERKRTEEKPANVMMELQ